MSVKDNLVGMPCSNQQHVDLSTKRKTGSFTRASRLLTAKQFSNVFENPYKCHHAYLLILARKNSESKNLQVARLGLAVAKKNIKLAVRRNRFKRIVRENFRQHKVQLAGLDIVVLAKHAANGATSQQLRTVLEQQWQHLAKQFNTRSY
ncbi:Ribonuclease P protein component [hydrothermal vent metagenome]|uniref:Ribonuclease P protein component n=1 Tax=hydrothermal vent metagenome TaxID=652676 RepID=A0A3B0ZL08_9ZZZZ